MLAGPNFARLLPVAMLLGAAFLLAVDTLARTLARGDADWHSHRRGWSAVLPVASRARPPVLGIRSGFQLAGFF
jgi:hypothetical protein